MDERAQRPPPPALHAGQRLAQTRKGPLTSAHIVRWLAAQQNWDKIHYDQQYCRAYAGLDAPVVNGALKQHFIAQHVCEAIPHGWLRRIDYQFIGTDVVGSTLQVNSEVTAIEPRDQHSRVVLDVEIRNEESGLVTTRGRATVIVPAQGVLAQVPETDGSERDELSKLHPGDSDLPDAIARALGTVIETRESMYPLDLSRLRLFAEAVMGLPAHHFDPAAGERSIFRATVATPLFPLHGLEGYPGERELSVDPTAIGREGVYEVGRDLGSLFALPASGLLNGGNKVLIHSLLRVGERVHACSRLAAAKFRSGQRVGRMLIVETLNDYWESGGRPLLTERQTMICRLG